MLPPAASAPSVESVATEVLEVLLEGDEAGRTVGVGELASRIPSAEGQVERAVEGLVADGTARRDGGLLALTDVGRARAGSVVRRHRLTERLLADVIGLEWWKVHHEAARWGDVLSEDVEARIVQLLDDPGSCPHGNPIPGSTNRREHADAVRLADVEPGPVRVVRITETLEGDDEALQLLQGAGFLPGRDAEVQERQAGWVHVAGSVRDAALPPHVAEHTYVVPC